MKSRYLALAVVAVLAAPSLCHAALITSAAALVSPTVIDFRDFDTGSYTFTAGPTQIGASVGEDVVWTGGSAISGFAGAGYGLNTNGTWSDPVGPTGRNGYSFTNEAAVSMTYSFNYGPVRGVGGFIN